MVLLLLVARVAAADTGAIRGVVLDTAGGAPIRSVSVRLQSSGQSVVTDDEGRFAFADVAVGAHELYVSAVDFILVKRTITVTAGVTAEVTIALTEGTGAYSETVNVSAPAALARREPAVAAEQLLGSRELQQLRGILTNDPMRAVQVLPAVAAGDDFRSEFAVRGAGVGQMNFTFEGIATPFLLHTVQQVHDSGSIAMINGDVLEEISLSSGAYPQRHGNRTASEIDFRMREGSRDRVRSHLAVSAIDASGVVEGPIGSNRAGSWLFSARKSYLDLIVEKLYPEQGISFGFTDAQAKAAYDLNPRHQLQIAFTAGRSLLTRSPDELSAGNLRDAKNTSVMAVATWRYLASPAFSVTQRLAVADNRFTNLSRDGAELDGGQGRDFVYRADATRARGMALLEFGGEARVLEGEGHEQRLSQGRFQTREDFDAQATALSVYAQTRLTSSSNRWTVTPGARVDRRSLGGRTTASPWVQAMAPIAGGLTLRGGAGIHRQAPGFAEVLGSRGTRNLRDERAYHVDAAVEGLIGSGIRWQIAVYNREDRDLLRLPGIEQRVVDDTFVNSSLTTHFVNALEGHARGVELLARRQSLNGLSGWVSYAYGIAEYRDTLTGEAFTGDFDQRHTVNLYGTYRLSDRTSVSGRFRLGSNFPTTGYWTTRDGVNYLGTERNQLRVPAYARLDLRANRTFTWPRTRLTLFMEAINLLNRDNVRFALPSVNRRTFEATGLYETLIPLIPSVGVLIEF